MLVLGDAGWRVYGNSLYYFCKSSISLKSVQIKSLKKKNIGFVVRVVRHDKEENNPETLFTDGWRGQQFRSKRFESNFLK